MNTRKSSFYIVFGALGVAVALGILGIAILTQAPRTEAEIIGSDIGFADDNATIIQQRILDVAVMQCIPWGEGQPSTVPIVIVAYSNSTNAPFYPFGTNCAQAISDLMSNDFEIGNVQPGGSNGGAFYTMIRYRYVNLD